MKRKVLLYVIISSILVLISLMIYSKRPVKMVNPASIDLSLVQTGDLVFTVGHSLKSDLVRTAGPSNPYNYSHVGFIRRVDSLQVNIVHMSIDSGYIISQPFAEFCPTNDVLDVGIYQLNRPLDPDRMARSLDSIVATGKPFDNGYSLNDTSAYYCTEFIIRTLQENGIYYDYQGLCSGDILFPGQLAGCDLLKAIRVPEKSNQ